MAFQQAVEWSGNAFRVHAEVTQIVANERELCLLGIYLLNGADPLYRFGLKNAATKPVNGIRGINDDASIEKTIDHGSNVSRLWIIRMDMK